MASMNLDPSSALAEKYKGNRQVLEAAVLGRGADANIDPYSALRALQKLNMADKYEQMQKAMAGQPNPPSIAQQTVAAAQRPVQAPQAPQQLAQAPQATQGLGAMPVPEDTFNMAGGGIVAFAAGDEVRSGMGSMNKMFTYQTEIDPLKEAEYFEKYRKDSDPEGYYSAAREQLEDMREMGPGDLEQAKGLAALQAAAALSQGSDFVRGLGAAGAAFGESYGKAVDAANKEKRALSRMELELKNQERQERRGDRKAAQEAAERAVTNANAATNFRWEQQKALMEDAREREKIAATLKAATESANDPTWQMQVYNSYYSQFVNDPKNQQEGETPEQFSARAQVHAAEKLAEHQNTLGVQAYGLKSAQVSADIETRVNKAVEAEYWGLGDKLMAMTPEERIAWRTNRANELRKQYQGQLPPDTSQLNDDFVINQ